ncbi:hypothetical protein KUTeg_010198, partial [Tegillarca granosa]
MTYYQQIRHFTTWFRLFQKTLDEIKQSWNNHCIRSYRNQLLTSGRPWMLHSAPAINRTRDYGVGVDRRDIEICAAEVHHKADIPCDRTVFDICILNIGEHKLSVPSNPDDMYELDKFLRRTVRAEIKDGWGVIINHNKNYIKLTWQLDLLSIKRNMHISPDVVYYCFHTVGID